MDDAETNDKGFTDQERRALRQIAQRQIAQWPTRRQALGAAGAAAAIGYGAGTVSADSETSDSQGDVGTPTNPIDAHIETITGGGSAIEIDDDLIPGAGVTPQVGLTI